MARSDAMKNALAQAWANKVDRVAIHIGDPGTTGANDSGITHVAVTWPGGPTAGVISSNPIDISVPAGTHMTHVGAWNSTDGFLESFANNINFVDATTYRLTLRYTQS